MPYYTIYRICGHREIELFPWDLLPDEVVREQAAMCQICAEAESAKTRASAPAYIREKFLAVSECVLARGGDE